MRPNAANYSFLHFSLSRLYQIGLIVLLALTGFSCEKTPVNPVPVPDEPQLTGVLVLNEGLYGMNNSGITFFHPETQDWSNNWFQQHNGRPLGDTGNDMAIYGGKLYIIVSGSSQLEVIDLSTGLSVAQIPFFDQGTPRQPRALAFHEDKAYVCSFDGSIAMIDTTSLQIQKTVNVGHNPDGITVSNQKLYVSLSGGLDFPVFYNQVVVLDAYSLELITHIEVGVNPFRLEADKRGMVYLISRGNYSDLPMRLQIIDSQNDQLIHTFTGFEAMDFSISGDVAFVYHHDFFGDAGSSLIMLDLNSREIIRDDFITDGTTLETIYGLYADPLSGDVFVTDAMGFTATGRVYCFDSHGVQRYWFEAGLNPKKIAVRYEQD